MELNTNVCHIFYIIFDDHVQNDLKLFDNRVEKIITLLLFTSLSLSTYVVQSRT